MFQPSLVPFFVAEVHTHDPEEHLHVLGVHLLRVAPLVVVGAAAAVVGVGGGAAARGGGG